MVTIKRQLDGLALAISLLGILLVYPYLDLATRVVLPAAILVGAWCDRRERYFIGRRVATLASIAVFVFYLLQIDRSNLTGPVINTVILLLAVRLLTEKEGRHYLQIFLLAHFALAGSTLYTLTLAFLPVLVVMLACLISGLVLLACYSADPRIRFDGRQYRLLVRSTLLLPTGTLLLMLAFFLILPRTEHALWDFLNPAPKARSALSEQVRPGSFASSAGDDTVVFRVEMEEVPPASLYWRTLTLSAIDGTTWVAGKAASGLRPEVAGGTRIEQEFYPSHFASRFITALDTPEEISGLRYQWHADGSAKMYRIYKKARHYRSTSRIGGSYYNKLLKPGDLLELPPRLGLMARQASAGLVRAEMSRPERIAAIEGFFQRQQLSYATDNLPTDGDPVDTFLFSSKRGYCEYFASSFAVMLRQAGIPTRLVGGYLGGEYNAFAGYYAVSERMAHVWVEALLDDGRWLRLDPSRFAVNADSALISSRTGRSFGFSQLADSIDYFWNQAIVAFDLGRQLGTLRELRDQARSMRGKGIDVRPLAGPAAILALLAGGALILYRHRPARMEKRLLRRFLAAVRQRYGLDELPPSATLSDIGNACPSENCREFVRLYAAAYYRDRSLTGGEIAELNRLIERIRKG